MGKDWKKLFDSPSISLCYYTNWSTPFLHCRPDPQYNWTTMPGLAFEKKAPMDLPITSADGRWVCMHFPRQSKMDFALHDGGMHKRWDKPRGGGDYSVSGSGIWLIQHGAVEKLVP